MATDRRSQNIAYLFLVSFLVVFTGLRWEVGCDWSSYEWHFFIVSDPNFQVWARPVEHGYWFLIDFIQSVGLPYVSLNLIVSAIFFVCIHFFAKRLNDPYTLVLVLFPMLILGIVMSAIRQAVAVGFVTMALLAFVDRAPIKMIFLLLVGSTFHISAIIFAPLIPIAWGTLNKTKVAIGLAMALPIAALVAMGESAERANDIYVGTEIVSRGVLIRLGSLVSTAAMFWLFLRRSWRKNSPKDYPLALILLWGTLALILISGPASVVADRLSYYLVPLQGLVVVRAHTLPDIRSRRAVIVTQWAIFTIALLGWMTVSQHFSQCYDPYSNVIFNAFN